MKPIKGYEHYFITENGDVYNKRGMLMKPCLAVGYLKLTICVKGKKFSKKIHRMVAQTFIPNPEGKRCVNHKNGIKTDNRVENLEWCTNSENDAHAFATGLRDTGRIACKRVAYLMSQANRRPILQYSLTGEFIKEFPSVGDVRKSLGVRRSTIADCAKGRRDSAYGFKWAYKSP